MVTDACILIICKHHWNIPLLPPKALRTMSTHCYLCYLLLLNIVHHTYNLISALQASGALQGALQALEVFNSPIFQMGKQVHLCDLPKAKGPRAHARLMRHLTPALLSNIQPSLANKFPQIRYVFN